MCGKILNQNAANFQNRSCPSYQFKKKSAIIYIIAVNLAFGLLIDIKKGASEDWAAKINTNIITMDEFNFRFNYYLKFKYPNSTDLSSYQNDNEIKKNCLQEMIDEKLVFNEAKKNKIDEKKETKDMIRLYAHQIILNAYIEEKMKNEIFVSDKEVNDYLKGHKDQFDKVDLETAKNYIRKNITYNNYTAKLNEILNELKNNSNIKIYEENLNKISGKELTAKIDHTEISIDDFYIRFDFYLRSKYPDEKEASAMKNSLEEKKECLKDMINEKLVFNKAKKMKIDEKEQVKGLTRLYTQQIIISVYLEKIPGHKGTVSEKEIDDYYKKHSDEFNSSDLKTSRQKIKKIILKAKYDAKTEKIVKDLKKRAKIKINENFPLEKKD